MRKKGILRFIVGFLIEKSNSIGLSRNRPRAPFFEQKCSTIWPRNSLSNGLPTRSIPRRRQTFTAYVLRANEWRQELCARKRRAVAAPRSPSFSFFLSFWHPNGAALSGQACTGLDPTGNWQDGFGNTTDKQQENAFDINKRSDSENQLQKNVHFNRENVASVQLERQIFIIGSTHTVDKCRTGNTRQRAHAKVLSFVQTLPLNWFAKIHWCQQEVENF